MIFPYLLIASLMGLLVGWFIEFVRPGGTQDLRDQLNQIFEGENKFHEILWHGVPDSTASKAEVGEREGKSSRSLPDICELCFVPWPHSHRGYEA